MYTTDDYHLYNLSPISVFENTNNNANTEGDDSGKEEPAVNHDRPHLYASVKPPLHDTYKSHKYASYIDSILTSNFTTKYIPKSTKKPKPKLMTLYVPACVMAHLILEDQYITEESEDGKDMSFYPKTATSVWKAMESVISYAINTTFGEARKQYPYIPYNYNLPDLHPVPDYDYSFRNHSPIPDPATWTRFMFASTNLHYRHKTYAANCRHGTSHWDEHP